MKYFVLILALSGAITASGFAAEPTMLTGTVTHVRDGDTIEVGKIPIRLNGVSAPEMKEPLGLQSKQFMVSLVDGKPLSCELDGTKTYDRFVGTCYLDGKDIGEAVIASGLALDCPRFSGGRYAGFEVAAAQEAIKLPKSTQESADAIDAIATVIREIEQIATAIAVAVEEQSAATSEIARNVEQAAAGTQEVSSNIASVSNAASETGKASNEIVKASQALSQQSEMLESEVATFLTQIRAG